MPLHFVTHAACFSSIITYRTTVRNIKLVQIILFWLASCVNTNVLCINYLYQCIEVGAMKQRSILWHAAGFAAATLGGTILHFLYDWAGQNILASPFSGINESTWEHMKLLFWPLVFFAFIQWPFFKAQGNYWCVKLEEVLLGLALIPVLFYSYNGVFGKSPDWVNIAIFYVTAALVFSFERRAFKKSQQQCNYPWLAVGAICLIGVLFVVFAFAPPHIPLFRDPLTGTYGIGS